MLLAKLTSKGIVHPRNFALLASGRPLWAVVAHAQRARPRAICVRWRGGQ